MSQDLTDRQNILREMKKLDEMHPFEAYPKKVLLRKKDVDDKKYDGFFIGDSRSPDAYKEDKLKAKAEYKNALLDDMRNFQSIQASLFDGSAQSNRKPVQRKTTQEPDIDMSCGLLRLGADDGDSSVNKKALNRQIMLDNIAAATVKSHRPTAGETFGEFYIGTDPALVKSRLKQDKLQYKDMLDQDMSPRRETAAPGRTLSGRRQPGDDRVYVDHTGLTGLNIGSLPESPEHVKVQKQLYRDQLAEQVEHANSLKAMRKDQSRLHFTGKLPFLQGYR
jgi:hypothetical protein